MSRRFPLLGVVITVVLVALSGCRPQQPFYFFEDGDLSHYLDVATEIEYPDVEEERLGEVDGAARPFSLENSEPREIWKLSLEEAVRYALANSKVMRSIGAQIQGPPDFLVRNVQLAPTVYDPAIIESDPRRGVEAALSAFDAQFSSSLFWEKIDTPRNVVPIQFAQAIFPRINIQDLGSFQARLTKTTATGGTWSLTHNVRYDQSNQGIRRYPSDWNVNLEGEFRQPLLQGAGVQFNRISGPGAIPGFFNGVMIARINTDIALADFEAGVRDLVYDVEVAYWELYFAYRSLDAIIAGRDSGLRTWREVHVELEVGSADAHEEARARQQYFSFRGAMEQALSNLYAAESKLRYVIGLAATDGRLVRPSDEPTPATVRFDWHEVHEEALARSVEIRKEKWALKQRELELIAAKNYLLPRLDAVGTYRWLGLGDRLINPSGGSSNPAEFDSDAYQSMTDGEFQEWQFGLELSFPFGFRKENAGVRNAQLLLARERARLQELELELSHQLAHAIRELEAMRVLTQTNFNRRVAAQAEVDTAQIKYEAGLADWTLDAVLDAQRRLAEAESAYYRTLVDYNQQIAQVHLRKGSLLEYNGVYLREGPWPAKAYFDAHRRARARDASIYLDYGYTRPKVASRGPYAQHADSGVVLPEGEIELERPEEIPLGVPLEAPPESEATEPTAPQPEAGSQAGESAIDGPELVAAQPAKETAEPDEAKRPYDLGRLNLDKLAGKSAGKEAAAAGQWSAVKRAAYEEPVTDAKTESRESIPTESSSLNWQSSESPGVRHESVANPPAAQTDRPASVWRKVQR